MQSKRNRQSDTSAASEIFAIIFSFCFIFALLAFSFPATCLAADIKSSDQNGSIDPMVYFDFSIGFSSSTGNAFTVGRRGFFTVTGASSQGLNYAAPLTIDVNDRLTVYAGIDAGHSKSGSGPWSELTLGSLSAGFDYTILEQTGSLPQFSLTGSYGRPVKLEAGTPLTTTWSFGLDADYSLDEDSTRGLLAGVALTHTIVNTTPGNAEPVIGGYLGAYRQWETGWKLTGKAGYAEFGGASIGSLIRTGPVRQVFGTLLLEKLDEDDNQIAGLTISGARTIATAGKPATSIQLIFSFPLYVTRNKK